LPLHLLIKWGAGANDLDLHLTGGPKNDRFHVYYLNKGSLDGNPRALMIDDCISKNCSEVIRVEEFQEGDVYRASVFNFDERNNPNSTNISNDSGLEIELIRGGTPVAIEGDTDLGVTISGGEVIFTTKPTTGQVGTLWTAAEINTSTLNVELIDTFSTTSNSREIE